MTPKALPPVATKIPSKLNWDFNASTGSSIAQLNPATRLVRSGRDGKFLYRAEYWGDHSLDFPIGSNALTASAALEDLKKDVAKLKRGRGTPSPRHHATKKSPAVLQREIDAALAKRKPASSKPTDMFIPTNAGKYIADYVRNDREHLGVELRTACQKPKTARERDLREIAWAAVDNINHAWEGRLGLITRGDITDAVEHLQRWCDKQKPRR